MKNPQKRSAGRSLITCGCDLVCISAISAFHLGSDLGYNLGALFVSLMIAMHCLIARQLKQSHNNTNTVMISVPMPQLT